VVWRDYVCNNNKCHFEERAGNFFDALKNVHADSMPRCKECGGSMSLRLQFPFRLGIGRTKCTVLDVFLPTKRPKWNAVVFHPFLVVLKRGRTTAYWLPYWHVDGGKKKYGQWAPFIDEPVFKEILAQARQKGYLRP
jgi:hypothetical protein